MPPKRTQSDRGHDEQTTVKSSRESKKCNECRRRHVKCDEQRPKCSNCIKSNSECSYSDRSVRYNHISDRQRRDDMYTEISDISKCVDGLLNVVQNESMPDDVAKLAINYGWQVTLAPNGQKRILTDIGTMAQLAALVPKALHEGYGDGTRHATLPLTPHASLPDTPLSNSIHSDKDTPKPQRQQRRLLSLSHYLPQGNQHNSPTSRTEHPCPLFFTFIVSPHIMDISAIGQDPELASLQTSILCKAKSLYSCSHHPEGLYPHSLSTVSVSSFRQSQPASHLVSPSDIRFGECTHSNVFWSLVKTAQLMDEGLFNQAYVLLGVTISKAFSLQLHKPAAQTRATSALEREMIKRLFWAIWLFDTQMVLLRSDHPSIQLADIHTERPSLCPEMLQSDHRQTHQTCTDRLFHLIEVRWLRVKLERELQSLSGNTPAKTLAIITQQTRHLRRFYDQLPENFKFAYPVADPLSTKAPLSHDDVMILLEHAFNWIVLFDPLLPEPETIAMFPENLAIHMCRQAADMITLLFEQWIWVSYDCQSRIYLCHLVNAIAVHKYICSSASVSVVHRWKAYASLRFLLGLLQKTPELSETQVGQGIVASLQTALHLYKDVTERGWSPLEQFDLIESLTKYFSEWRPSFDPFESSDPAFLLARESLTMQAIMEMRKTLTPVVPIY